MMNVPAVRTENGQPAQPAATDGQAGVHDMFRQGDLEGLDPDPAVIYSQRDEDLRQQLAFGSQRPQVIPKSKPEHHQGAEYANQSSRSLLALRRIKAGDDEFHSHEGRGE